MRRLRAASSERESETLLFKNSEVVLNASDSANLDAVLKLVEQSTESAAAESSLNHVAFENQPTYSSRLIGVIWSSE